MFQKSPYKHPLSWALYLVGIALVVAGIMLTTPSAPLSDPVQEAEQVSDALVEKYELMVQETGAGVIARAQQPSDRVVVDRATFADPGFLIVSDDEEGAPGEMIGSSDLIVGDYWFYEFDLDELMKVGEVYYVLMVSDDGDQVLTDGDGLIYYDDGVVNVMSFSVQE